MTVNNPNTSDKNSPNKSVSLSSLLEQTNSGNISGFSNESFIRNTVIRLSNVPFTKLSNTDNYGKTIDYINNYGSDDFFICEDSKPTFLDIFTGIANVICNDLDDENISDALCHMQDFNFISYKGPLPYRQFNYSGDFYEYLPLLGPTLSFARLPLVYFSSSPEITSLRQLNYNAFLRNACDGSSENAIKKKINLYFPYEEYIELLPPNKKDDAKPYEELAIGDVLDVVNSAIIKFWVPNGLSSSLEKSIDKYVDEKIRAYKLFFSGIFCPLTDSMLKYAAKSYHDTSGHDDCYPVTDEPDGNEETSQSIKH